MTISWLLTGSEGADNEYRSSAKKYSKRKFKEQIEKLKAANTRALNGSS